MMLPYKGHKEWARPDHATACPGDEWEDYRADIEERLTIPDKDQIIKDLRGQELVIFGILQALSIRDWRRIRDIAQAVVEAQPR